MEGFLYRDGRKRLISLQLVLHISFVLELRARFNIFKAALYAYTTK